MSACSVWWLTGRDDEGRWCSQAQTIDGATVMYRETSESVAARLLYGSPNAGSVIQSRIEREHHLVSSVDPSR